MDVPGAARVQTRHDRLQPEAAVGVGELVAAQPVPLVVVVAGGIG
jgi:hypothetical protein